MLWRGAKTIVFECDGCGDELDTDTTDLREAKDYLKDSDWRARMEDTLWCHYCFSCDEGIR